VSAGRTSRLNRFLSMPRYRGASRKRMNLGATTGLVPGSLIVLITAFLLVGADSELEIHRVHAPTEEGDAAFRTNGPSFT
jgi:hypothetical protein